MSLLVHPRLRPGRAAASKKPDLAADAAEAVTAVKAAASAIKTVAKTAAVAEGSEAAGLAGRLLWNVRHGRFERTLSLLTAAGSLITAAEIYLEHDRASFGNKMMCGRWRWVLSAWRQASQASTTRRRRGPCCRSRPG